MHSLLPRPKENGSYYLLLCKLSIISFMHYSITTFAYSKLILKTYIWLWHLPTLVFYKGERCQNKASFTPKRLYFVVNIKKHIINTDNKALPDPAPTYLSTSPHIAPLCPGPLLLSLPQPHRPSCFWVLYLTCYCTTQTCIPFFTTLPPLDLGSEGLFLREAFPDLLDWVKCPL